MAFSDAEFTPDVPEPIVEVQAIKWKIYALSCEWGQTEESALVTAMLRGLKADDSPAVDSNGKQKALYLDYTGAVARAVINDLDARDYTTTPLHEQLLIQFQTDGKLPAGTIG